MEYKLDPESELRFEVEVGASVVLEASGNDIGESRIGKTTGGFC